MLLSGVLLLLRGSTALAAGGWTAAVSCCCCSCKHVCDVCWESELQLGPGADVPQVDLLLGLGELLGSSPVHKQELV
jgi:hypothetical protein